jgi:pteridine reductase
MPSPEMQPSRRVALVTGGAVRVGAAIVRKLASEGIDVAIHHRSSGDEAHALAREMESEGRRALPVRAEITDEDQVDAMMERIREGLGGLDYLVASAAIFEKVPFRELTRERWRRMQQVNCEAQAFLVQRALPMLERSPAAAVVVMVDIGGRIPWKGYCHYNVSKAGVDMLVRVLARELAPDIRVNGVAPGAVLFPPDADEKHKERLVARIPAGRPGTPEEAADAVHFLLEGPSFITGQIVAVDGGRSLGGR